MKKTHLITLVVLATITLFTSCIQEEAPNTECDIVSVDTTHSWFITNEEILTGDFSIENNAVTFFIEKTADFKAIGINHESIIDAFILTSGAKIEKYSGNDDEKKEIKIDHNGILLYYTVSSEDGIWSKEYSIKFIKMLPLDIDHLFGFENFTTQKFTTWSEINKDGITNNIWASGNAGFSMSGLGKSPEDYPTSTFEDGVTGNCVKLTTRSTGKFGKMMKMPIAAGNIFIGEFQSANATKAPLEATRFGLPIAPGRPVSLTGYYKYTPGEVFTDKAMNEIEGRVDTCSIYSVLYEIDPNNFEPLNGGNVLSSDRIVLVAELENPSEPTEWTQFKIPYKEFGGKTFDYKKLESGEYAITVVASSSKDGAYFEGAVGSTLYIDEIKINWEN